MKIVCVASLMIVLVMQSVNAQAQWTVFCPDCSDKFTQALDRITNIEELQKMTEQVSEAVRQTEEQIRIAQTTFDQLENMIKNTVSLPATIKGRIQGEFGRVKSLIDGVKTLRGDASALSQIYRATYTGRSALDGISRQADAPKQYKDIMVKSAEQMDRALEAALQVSGAQIQEMEEKADALDSQLSDLLQTPEGQMQAIQAGNQIAGMQLQAMQRVHFLLATSAQASTQKMADDNQRQEVRDAENAKAAESFKRVGDEFMNMNKTPF